MSISVLKQNEFIEDLQFLGLQIILNKNLPAFTTDSVLLSDFARVHSNDYVADLGTGTGIIPLLMYGRYAMRAVGFELQEELCDMANRSFELNRLQDKLCSEHMDFRKAYCKYNSTFSVVVCNPPYFTCDSGLVSDDIPRAITRSTLACNLDDVILAATRLLKSGGKLFICYPAAQLADLIYSMRTNGVEPKRLRLVRSRVEKPPYLLLVEARKDGGKGITYENDLVLQTSTGSETDEIKRIYHR